MSEGIVYQNKDIEFKILSEAYRERSFGAYGLNLPKIKEVLPTDLPAVSANEMRMVVIYTGDVERAEICFVWPAGGYGQIHQQGNGGSDKEGDHNDQSGKADI